MNVAEIMELAIEMSNARHPSERARKRKFLESAVRELERDCRRKALEEAIEAVGRECEWVVTDLNAGIYRVQAENAVRAIRALAKEYK